jgi:hypothetical protein
MFFHSRMAGLAEIVRPRTVRFRDNAGRSERRAPPQRAARRAHGPGDARHSGRREGEGRALSDWHTISDRLSAGVNGPLAAERPALAAMEASAARPGDSEGAALSAHASSSTPCG